MSLSLVHRDFSSLHSVAAVLESAPSEDGEIDSIFQEALLLFWAQWENFKTSWEGLELALRGVSPLPFLAGQDPAVVALVLQLAGCWRVRGTIVIGEGSLGLCVSNAAENS